MDTGLSFDSKRSRTRLKFFARGLCLDRFRPRSIRIACVKVLGDAADSMFRRWRCSWLWRARRCQARAERLIRCLRERLRTARDAHSTKDAREG